MVNEKTAFTVGDRVELVVREHSLPSIRKATIKSFDRERIYPVVLRLDEPTQHDTYEWCASEGELVRLEEGHEGAS